jgi:hypothetical protein
MPAAKNDAAAPTVKDGFRIDDEVAVYLSNVSKLSPKTYKTYTRSLELFRQSSGKSTSTRSPSKTCKRSTRRE